MKKEIMELVNSEEGTLRINNVSYLHRWTKDGLGNKVDKLVLEFDNINHVNFGIANRDIESRDYDGIVRECEDLTNRFFAEVSRRLTSDLKAGYKNTSKE